MDKFDQLNEISSIALAGKAITLAFSADENIGTLKHEDVSAILYDLVLKFEQISQLANSPTTDARMTAA